MRRVTLHVVFTLEATDLHDRVLGTSNAECEAQIRALAQEYGEIVVVICGGSNVFAVQYDVLARVGR